MIVARLVLGTARIAGGAGEAAAVALVQSAFDSGVCYVDTAPSYGSGTAEVVVGQALAGHPQIAVTTKLGSARPSQPWLRTFARRLKRLARPASTPSAEFAPTRIERPSGSDFTIAAMAQSLEISRERLGRIDLLLLHDVSASEVTAALLESLTGLSRSVGALGRHPGLKVLIQNGIPLRIAGIAAQRPDAVAQRGQALEQRCSHFTGAGIVEQQKVDPAEPFA